MYSWEAVALSCSLYKTRTAGWLLRKLLKQAVRSESYVHKHAISEVKTLFKRSKVHDLKPMAQVHSGRIHLHFAG